MDTPSEVNLLPIMVPEGFLEMTDEAKGAQESQQHAAELAQNLLPFG
jgi:hypothetical protein